jgi:hypothetical protein
LDKKEERKRNLCCALLAFNEDEKGAEKKFAAFRHSGHFDQISSAFLAGQACEVERIASNVKAVKAVLPDVDDRSLAILASSLNIDIVLDKYNALMEKFKKEMLLELPPLPMSIIVTYSQRGISPTIYQYKLLKNRPENFDEVSIAVLATVGDVGGALERYRAISSLDNTIPMQAKAILSAYPKNLRDLKNAYGIIMKEKAQYEKLGQRSFDNMVAAILALNVKPAIALYLFKKFKQSNIWR